MKKYAFIASLFISATAIAQSITPNEGLKYGTDHLNGTARFNGMSGAFGAVGGDLSAMGINPAGSLFFKNNTASISLKYDANQNKAGFLGNETKKNVNQLSLNQAGAIFVYTNPERDLNKLVIGVNYETKASFKNKYSFSGTSNSSDIEQYFLDYANGTNGLGVFPIQYATDYNFSDFGNFADQQAWLGYNSYLLDYDTSAEGYYSNIPNGVAHFQQKNVVQKGYNSKIQLNLAGAIKDKLLLGGNLNAHLTNSEKNFTIIEKNNGLYPTGITVNDTYFDNYVLTTGGGFNLDLGAIYKVNDAFRFGISYASPTWYNLRDEVQQGIYTVRTEELNPNEFIGNNLYPQVTTVFDSYNFRTPSKFTGSIAAIVGKKWLISADVITTDLSKTKYTTNGFEIVNNYFRDNLQRTYEYRIGTEILLDNFALRAGYRLSESPYKQQAISLNKDTSTISTGVGYNFGKARLDLSYSLTNRNFNEEFISNNWQNSANIKNKNNAVTLTYTVNF